MTNPAQTLVRMIGFLIIVGIIAGFYAPLVDAFLANPALNGMILVALLIGILFASDRLCARARKSLGSKVFGASSRVCR